MHREQCASDRAWTYGPENPSLIWLECPTDNPPRSDNPPRPVFSVTRHAYVLYVHVHVPSVVCSSSYRYRVWRIIGRTLYFFINPTPLIPADLLFFSSHVLPNHECWPFCLRHGVLCRPALWGSKNLCGQDTLYWLWWEIHAIPGTKGHCMGRCVQSRVLYPTLWHLWSRTDGTYWDLPSRQDH